MSATGNRSSLKLEEIPGRMLATVGAKSFKVQMPFIPESDVIEAVNIAIEKHGTQNPYSLIDETTASEIKRYSPRDRILDLALTEFRGALKITPMFEFLDGEYTRDKIRDIVQSIADEEIIEHNSQHYKIKKQRGNFYALIPIESENSQALLAS